MGRLPIYHETRTRFNFPSHQSPPPTKGCLIDGSATWFRDSFQNYVILNCGGRNMQPTQEICVFVVYPRCGQKCTSTLQNSSPTNTYGVLGPENLSHAKLSGEQIRSGGLYKRGDKD